jgi:hypothetical protein
VRACVLDRRWRLAKAVRPRSSGEEGVVAADLNPEGLSNHLPAPALRISRSRLIRFAIALGFQPSATGPANHYFAETRG